LNEADDTSIFALLKTSRHPKRRWGMPEAEDRIAVLLDQFPGPLTLRPSTWKWLGLLAFSIAGIACGAWFIRDPGIASDSRVARFGQLLMSLGLAHGTSQAIAEFGWFMVIVCAIGSVVGIITLLPGAAGLTLNRDGFVVRSLFRTQAYRWLDADEFAVVEMKFPVGCGRKKFVGFNDPSVAKRSIAAVNVKLIGRNSMLPDSYGLSVEDLARLVSRWRERAVPQSK
jgi:hypothetical protein